MNHDTGHESMSQTVRSVNATLQTLFDLFYGVENDFEMYDCMNQAVELVMSVLGYAVNDFNGNDDYQKLVLRGSYNKYVVDEISLNAYRQQNQQHPNIHLTNILSLISNTLPTELSRLQQVLKCIQAIENQYESINGYKHIVSAFKQLVTSFIQIQQDSEHDLIRFLNKSFNNELRQLPNIQLQLEELGIFLNDSTAENIASFIEQSLGTHLGSDASASQSVHMSPTIYQGFQNTLGFESSDVNFKSLFYLFLQISSVRYNSSPVSQDFSRLISLMLSVYKKSCGFGWLETADYQTLELKLKLIHEFFLNFDEVDIDRKVRLADVCNKLIESYNFFPETRRPISDRTTDPITNNNTFGANNQSWLPGSVINAPSSLGREPGLDILPKSDETALLNNIQRLFSQLNEFNFNFDTAFHATLKLFIRILNSSDNDFVVEEDLKYLNRLIQLVNDIVEFENDETSNNGGKIYQTALQLYEHHKLLALEFIGDSADSTLLMRYCANKVRKNRDRGKQILKKWNLNILRISQLEYSLEYTWKPYTTRAFTAATFIVWYKKWQRMNRMSEAATNYYDKSILLKLFISKFLTRFNSVRAQNSKAENFVLKKLLNRWNQRCTLALEKLDLAETHFDKTAIVNTYKIWKFKSNIIAGNNLKSLGFNEEYMRRIDQLLLQSVLDKWYRGMNQPLNSQLVHGTRDNGIHFLTDKLKKLDLRANEFRLKKFFSILKFNMDFSQKSRSVKDIHSSLMISFFFSKWKCLYELQKVSLAFESQMTSKVKKNLLDHWIHITKLNATAAQYSNKRQLKAALRAWKLNSHAERMNNLAQTKDRRTIEKSSVLYLQMRGFLKQWKLLAKCNILRRTNYIYKTQIFFQRWRIAQEKHKKMNGLSELLHNRFLAQRYIHMWYDANKFQLNLGQISDIRYLSRYWNKFLERTSRYTVEFNKRQREYEETHPIRFSYTLDNQLLAKGVLFMWKQKYENNFQEAAQWKIDYCQNTIVAKNLKSRYLVEWVIKYNDAKVKAIALNDRCDLLISRSSLKLKAFQKWRLKSIQVTSIENLGLDFQHRLLHKKYLVIWYDKYLNKSQYLNEICQELIDQKDLRSQREILSEWSMKYIKFITRNQQSCDLFIKRWESSRVKSIFDLWVFKLQDSKALTSSNPSKNVFLDSSFDSFVEHEESPLTLRTRPPPKIDLNLTGSLEDSYLNSPIKTQNNGDYLPPDTPLGNTGSNISPSRLQTSIRMKNEKIQALRQRYGRAKDLTLRKHTESTASTQRNPVRSNNSPVKPYSFLSHNSRLSPPKRPDFLSTPKKEEVVTNTSSRPQLFARKSSSTQSGGNPSSLEYGNDNHHFELRRPSLHTVMTQEDIDNAKRMRKIPPIFIPDSEDEPEPRLSPISTIRQRNSIGH